MNKLNRLLQLYFQLINKLSFFWLISFTIWFTSITFLLFELLLHPGILNKYLKISSTGLVELNYFLFLPLVNPTNPIIFTRKQVFTLLTILLIEVIIYNFLNSAEGTTYPNFVYHTYHINYIELNSIIKLTALPLILTIANLLLDAKKYQEVINNKAQSFIENNKLGLTLLLILLILTYQNIASLFSFNVMGRITYMLKNPFINTEKRLAVELTPDFYNYLQFIKNNTPSNARILIPPQDAPWYNYGNRGFMRYFLYPRILINGSRNVAPENFQDYDYCLVIGGKYNPDIYRSEEDWPQFQIPAKEASYLLPTGEIKKVDPLLINISSKNIPSRFGLLKF